MKILILIFPLLFLASSNIGSGIILIHLLRRKIPILPIWLKSAVAYFLGQGLIGTLFIFIGLAGWFTPYVIVSILTPLSAVFAWYIWKYSGFLKETFNEILLAWLKAPIGWKMIALLFVALLGYGVTTMGGWIEGDAIAFYLSIAKVLAASHKLAPLPGYESFSSVGLLAESMFAALFSMGMPNISPRIYSWVNFFPTIVVLYGISRICNSSRRSGLIMVIMATTSSATVLLWGSGKTDLFALGPGFCAGLFAILSWDKKYKLFPQLISGIFVGLACVFKLTYLTTLIPTVTIIICWKSLLDLYLLLASKKTTGFKVLIKNIAHDMFMFAIGFCCSFLPHIVKNMIMLDVFIGIGGQGSWYTSKTTWRILGTYPFALTYGRYWAQFGTISPIVLAFIPLVCLLPRNTPFRKSRLTAFACACLVGMIGWIILFPSIFMPRYFLAILLMGVFPVSVAADWFCRRTVLLAYCIQIAIAVTIIATPFQANSRFKTFNAALTFNYPIEAEDDCLVSMPAFTYCYAHKAINAANTPGDRLLMLTYYRFWLKPEILQKISTQKEINYIKGDDGYFWDKVKELGYRFILYDASLVQIKDNAIETPPEGIELHELYRGGKLVAYEIKKMDKKKKNREQ